MKKVVLMLLMMFSLSLVSAGACDLSVSLLNQDPYPAVPGDYVKLVFQLEGIEDSDCGDITFELVEDYPIVFDPWEQREYTFEKFNYVKDYQSTIMIPYEVRVDEDALDGPAEIEVRIKSEGDAAVLWSFDVEVDETTVEFEAYITDYDYTTRELTIEVLNIGSSDIEALTMEVPKQGNVEIKGSNRVVVGDLDSNEYTSADFEAVPENGMIDINLIYSDSINVRRTVNQKVSFDSSYFTNRIADVKTTSKGTYVMYAVIVLLIIWFIWGRIKKARKKKKGRR